MRDRGRVSWSARLRKCRNAEPFLTRELKSESYGVELLHAIGFVYQAKSRHYLATNQTFMGVGGWLHNIQGKYHVFSET
jgi:hypothetical protein